MTPRHWIAAAAINGLLGVGAGAFAAHGLRHMGAEQLESWVQTAASYQLWHAVALLTVGGMLAVGMEGRWLRAAAWLFLAGIVLFSGSLYLLALSDVRWFAMVTPLGGSALMLGWVALVLHGFTRHAG